MKTYDCPCGAATATDREWLERHLAEARTEALEEAALLVESVVSNAFVSQRLANAIRELKERK